MNTKLLSNPLKIALLSAAVACGVSLRATAQAPGAAPNPPVAFRDSAEAGMLRNAYVILATGDHDYKGHRVRAMRQIEAAAKLLNMDLGGDYKDRQPQPLSDAKLREAQGLIQNVLGAAEVKNQKRITNRLTAAVNQINIALSIH